MLDFDDTPFKMVKYWALMACRWFQLDGFLILKSSENNYHVVFNRTVSWDENMHIVAWICLQAHIEPLNKWFIMQCIKEASTLRLSPKVDKPSPRIVFRYGKECVEISNYLQYRRRTKDILRRRALASKI